MSDRKILLLSVLALVVLLVGSGLGFQAWRTNREPHAPATMARAQGPVAITNGQPIRLGATAPVTVDLFEDFHCPHCAEFEDEFGATLTAAQQRGQIQLALYPMAFIDAGSARAANAMACAAEAGFGATYYAGLFANHTLQWKNQQLISLVSLAGGTATPAFQACVTGSRHQAWVGSIGTVADQRGVTGTPTLFINGSVVDLSGLTPERLDQMFADAATK